MGDTAIRVVDTTLCEGEHFSGVTMTTAGKLEVARALAELRVDVIEAGFPIRSKEDLVGVRTIAREVRGPIIAGLAGANTADIDAAVGAVRDAARSRIHTFIATSPFYMEYKLRMTPDQVCETSAGAVRYARRFTDDIEFSAEDATRSDPEFLCRVFDAAITAGATTITVQDTMGYATPDEYARLLRALIERIPNSNRVIWSTHCHDDLGLAVANSLAGVRSGARQVECTINGIGGRAGNASLEEIVMALHTWWNYYGVRSALDPTKIYPASRLVSALPGFRPSLTKRWCPHNAVARAAGARRRRVLMKSVRRERWA